MKANPILVEITRGDLTESIHRGAYAVIKDDASVVSSAGDIDKLTYPRSSLKPLQALPLIETGAANRWALTDLEFAIACGSHSGEERHVTAVREWLERIGLSMINLGCGAQQPTSTQARRYLVKNNIAPSPLYHNCSGKHAGFLSTAWHCKEPLEGYLEKNHPVQLRIKQLLSEMTLDNIDVSPVAKDGCGAPIFGISLRGLALAMACYGTGRGLPDARVNAAKKLYKAMTAQPFMVAGTDRWDTETMILSGSRLIVKGGAEGVYSGCIPDQGIGIALKIDDGGRRAAETMMGLLLDRFGKLNPSISLKLNALSFPPILNSNGEKVGITQIHSEV